MSDTASVSASAIALLQAAFPAQVRGRPLGWCALRSWEERHGLVLPEPYRTFVAEIANGTHVGPPGEGGLLPLGEKPAGWEEWQPVDWCSPEPFDGTVGRRPDLPFPLKEQTEWEYDYYDDSLHSHVQHRTYQWGSVLLGRDEPGLRCTAAFWILVVAGPQRGQIWHLNDAAASPYAPRRHYVRVHDDFDLSPPDGFVEWVRDWHRGQGWWRTE